MTPGVPATAAPEAAPQTYKSGGTGLLRNTAIFAAASFFAYVISLAKTIIVTRYFGTSREMDAFTVSILIPNLLGALVTGSTSAGLVPIFSRAGQNGPRHRADVYRTSFAAFLIIGTVVTVLLSSFARPLTRLVSPTFDPYRAELATELARWSSLLVLVNVFIGVASAELLSQRKYFMVAAAPAAATSISVVGILLFRSQGAVILVWSLLAGLFVQALIVVVPSWQASAGGKSTRFRDPDVRLALRGQVQLFGVASIGIANVFIDQLISTLLPAGSVSALSYAGNLHMVVTQVVVMAMSSVVLTDLAELAGRQEWLGLRQKVRICAISSLMLAAPACLIIVGAGRTAVQILFQHGMFRADSSWLVYTAWAGYSIGLIPLGIGMVASRLANALHHNRILFRVGMVSLVLNAVLDYVLMRWLGLMGIALSTSCVYCVSGFLLYRALQGELGTLVDRKMLVQAGRVLLATAVGILPALLIRLVSGTGFLSTVIQVLIFVATVLASYQVFGLLEIHMPRSWRAWQYVRFSLEDGL